MAQQDFDQTICDCIKVLDADRRSSLEPLLSRRGSSSLLSGSFTWDCSSDFISWKVSCVLEKMSLIREVRRLLLEMSQSEFHRLLASVWHQEDAAKFEYRILRRQRKILEEELDEVEDKEQGYSRVLAQKRRSAARYASDGKLEGRSRARFKRDLIDYYQAAENKEDKVEYGERVWCHATGVYGPRQQTRAVQIIPYSLASNELGHLLGVEEIDLMEPGNGIEG